MDEAYCSFGISNLVIGKRRVVDYVYSIMGTIELLLCSTSTKLWKPVVFNKSITKVWKVLLARA